MTGPSVGSAAEEAARLLAAAQQWARRLAHEQHLATGSAECSVCPLCQAVAALRRVRPETAEHLLDAAGSLIAALRTAVVPGAGGPGAGGTEAGSSAAASPGAGAPGAGSPGAGPPGAGPPGAGSPGAGRPGAGWPAESRIQPIPLDDPHRPPEPGSPP